MKLKGSTATIRQNMFWSLLLAGVNYLFPLVVYMHVSRALGVEGVGVVGFVDSATTYFILFSMMGISTLGMRMTARARGNIRELSSGFWSLTLLHALFTLAVLLVMILATVTIPEFRCHPHLMTVGMCKLVFNVLLVEWLFIGLEMFRFIAVRTIIVKALYVAAVFLFVRGKGDVLVYYVLTMLVVVALAMINMGWAVLHLSLRDAKLNLRHWVGSYFSLGVFELVASTCVTLCSVWLGFASDDAEVGCFSTASKIVILVSALFWAYVQVMSPRDSRLLADGALKLLRTHILSGIMVVGIIGTVAGVLIYCFAPDLVMLLSGSGYEGAILPLRILAFALPLIGIGKVLTMQNLIPLCKDRVVACNSAVGLAVCAMVCALLIPHTGAAGAAIGWLAAEATTLIMNGLASMLSIRGK